MAQYMYFKYFAPYLGKAAIDANDALVETAGEIKKDPQGRNDRIRPLCSIQPMPNISLIKKDLYIYRFLYVQKFRRGELGGGGSEKKSERKKNRMDEYW